MANDQEMKLKSQKHHKSSLDKSLRPAVFYCLFRKNKKPLKSVLGYSAFSYSLSLVPLFSRFFLWQTAQPTTFLFDYLSFKILILL